MQDKTKIIGQRIKIIRITKKIAQIELAKIIGVSQAHLSNIESGRSSITMENLFKIQEALGCTLAEIFADLEKPQQEKPDSFTIEDLAQALMTLKK